MGRLSADYIPALRFAALTRFYDPVVRLTTRERRVKQALLDAAEIRSDATILDVGCGTGTLTVWIKEHYPDARVIGLDLDSTILEIARDKAEKAGVEIEIIKANAADIPLANASVDCVFSSLFFHHLLPAQKLNVMREIFRVLTEDGALHLSDWGRPSNRLMRGLFYAVQCLDSFATTEDNVRGLLVEHIERAGARSYCETASFDTVLGTLRLLQARKSG